MARRFAFLLSIAVLLGDFAVGAPRFPARGVQAQEAQLTVTPNSGPTGTTVVIEGAGCVQPRETAIVVFQNGEPGRGTIGGDGIYNIALDASGNFRITYSIPTEFAAGSLQGRGGGLIIPGQYQFITKPPVCGATFTVTAGLPRTGGKPATGGIPGAVLLLGGAATLAGIGLAGGSAVLRGRSRKGCGRSA